MKYKYSNIGRDTLIEMTKAVLFVPFIIVGFDEDYLDKTNNSFEKAAAWMVGLLMLILIASIGCTLSLFACAVLLFVILSFPITSISLIVTYLIVWSVIFYNDRKKLKNAKD